MGLDDKIQLFEDKRIRTAWDEEKEEWYFSVVDVVAVLTEAPSRIKRPETIGQGYKKAPCGRRCCSTGYIL